MNEQAYQRMLNNQEGGLICLTNLEAILGHYGDENLAGLARSIYKNTNCGLTLSATLHEGRIVHGADLAKVHVGEVRALRVSSIVEGSDAEVHADPIDLLKLEEPQDAVKAFTQAVEWVDAEAESHWEAARVDLEAESCDRAIN